jgi:hypothetical protein
MRHRTKWTIGLVALAAALGLGLGWWRWGEASYLRLLLESPSAGRCDKRLNRALLGASLSLGTRFVLAHQKPDGNFDYEYDWREKQFAESDQETRQAGALWGLTLLYQDAPSPQLKAGIERGLAYFDRHSRLAGGVRCTTYPGSSAGKTGTVALVALSYIEYLRAAPALPSEQQEPLYARLAEYLEYLRQSVRRDGLWYGDYDVRSCKPSGDASSYSDGEALLALVKAAKYLDQKPLLPLIRRTADAGKRLNIERALNQDGDSDVTKGYYQWSSMAFYELATSDFPEVGVYGSTLLGLADWMIDVHKVLTRSRNTGYAFEGLTHAYAWAKQRGDSARQAKYGCVIDIGLERLLRWQVGGPLGARYTSAAAPDDDQALGGVQNEVRDPALRIDVTQHQLHATLLARRYVYDP